MAHPRAPKQTPKQTPKKEQTHERIVRTAADAIRKHGYDGVSVADVMKEAGLTHGGFYAHFPSRDAMLAEALDRAAADSLENLRRRADAAGSQDPLEAFVTGYLSDRHLEAPEKGCTVAALGSETRRQTPEVRKVATRRIKELVDFIGRQLPGWGGAKAHEEALAAMSCVVGALLIARIVDDPALAKSVRKAAADLVRTGVAKS